MNLSGDYDKTTLKEQKGFLKELGPYRSLALQDSKEAFLRRVRKLWFIRWPLKPVRYLDFKGMVHRENQIWKVSFPSGLPNLFLSSDVDNQPLKDVCNDLMWSSVTSEVTQVHISRGWRVHLRICEARSGIYMVLI